MDGEKEGKPEYNSGGMDGERKGTEGEKGRTNITRGKGKPEYNSGEIDGEGK